MFVMRKPHLMWMTMWDTVFFMTGWDTTYLEEKTNSSDQGDMLRI